MKKFLLSLLLIPIGILTSVAQTFLFTGTMQTYTVPAGVTSLLVDVQGAAGGRNADPSLCPSRPGYGARVQGTLAVTPGMVLNIFVGGRGGDGTSAIGGNAGYNGGGFGEWDGTIYSGGGGGGGSDICIGGTTFADRVVVAAGGGGAGMNGFAVDADRGGDGGGLTGEDGFSVPGFDGHGLGGTPTAGGLGGFCSACTGFPGTNGSIGIGGDGGFLSTGGGGGGGYFGGGGAQWAGGAGGSSFSDPGFLTSVTHARGYSTGDGVVTITCVPPSAGPLSATTNICIAATATFTSMGTPGGTWTSGTPGVATIGSSSGFVTAVSAGTTDITYSVTTGCGTDISIVTVTVDAPPTVSAISGVSPVCESASALFTNATSGGVWSTITGNASVSTGGLVSGVTAGPDTVVYTVTNACGSIDDRFPMVVDPLPVVAPLSGPTTVCVAATITLTAPTPGGVWSTSNANATVSGGVVTGVTAGAVSILYSVTNACGTTTVSYPITVAPLPDAGTLTGPTSICVGGTGTLTSSGTPGGAWSASNANATVSGGLVTGISVGVDTIMYTVTNSCGTAVASIEVTVSLTPSAGTIVGPTNVCVGAAVTLTNATPGGTWSASNTNASISSGGIVTGITAGLDTISYTVTLSCGTATTTHIMTIDPLPSPGTISGPTSVCVGSTITLSSTVSGGFWGSINGNASASGGIITGVSPGTDTIIYAVFNACGSGTATYTVNVLPLPFAGTITGSASTVCVGSFITLTAGAPGGIWTSSSTAIANVFGGTVTGVSAGPVTISYSVTNSCGTASATYPVTVLPLPFSGTITGPTAVCETTTMILSDLAPGGTWSVTNSNATITSSGDVTGVIVGLDTAVYTVVNSCGTAISTYPFSITPLPHAGTITGASSVCVGAAITLIDTSAGGSGTWMVVNPRATVAGGVVSGVSTGVDTVLYMVTNSCGTDTAEKTVTVNDVPFVGPISGLSKVCVGNTITLTDTTTGGTWSSSTGSASVSGGVVTGVSLGVTTISYTRTNACGPTSSTHMVTVNAVPSAGVISGLSEVCPYEMTTYLSTIPGGVWTITNGHAYLDATGVLAGVNPGLDTVVYTVTNECGTSSVTFEVTVKSFADCDFTGVDPLAQDEAVLNVYPNPSKGLFNLLLTTTVDEPVVVVITNVLGAQVQVLTTTSNKITDISLNVSPGVYLLNVATAHGRYVARMIVE